jgi:putative transposase
VVYILGTGVAWEDLPERFGKPNSVHRRFRRWAVQGIWDVFGQKPWALVGMAA